MANKNYQNVNEPMKGQPEECQRDTQRYNRKPTRDMLEALNKSMDIARNTLTNSFKEIRDEHPELDIGSALRKFHISLIETIRKKPIESFNIVFGLLGLAINDSLTDEDKEALRNDTFENV